MSEPNPYDPHIRHTDAFRGAISPVDETSPYARETSLGEDWTTTTTVLESLVSLGFRFLPARDTMAPRIVAGIRSERDYRRECHRSVKALGHTAGRHLYKGIVSHENAASMLQEFVEISGTHDATKVGLELGHIELSSFGMPADEAWRRLDDMAERVVDQAHFEAIDAHDLPASHRVAIFNGTAVEKAGSKEIKLPRARTNFPVVDIGRTGIQLFVRVAVGYDNSDQSTLELSDLRQAHDTYMNEHAEEPGIVMVGERTFAYPISATLVALQRNQPA
jgi:hypothetical protein